MNCLFFVSLMKFWIHNCRPSSLSELTPYWLPSGLTRLGSEASNYHLTNTLTWFMKNRTTKNIKKTTLTPVQSLSKWKKRMEIQDGNMRFAPSVVYAFDVFLVFDPTSGFFPFHTHFCWLQFCQFYKYLTEKKQYYFSSKQIYIIRNNAKNSSNNVKVKFINISNLLKFHNT